MECTQPLKAQWAGKHRSGKDKLKILKKSELAIGDIKRLPCGKCLSCKTNKAFDWSKRAMLETKEWKQNWFITLTYSDENVPKTKKGYKTLRKTDLSAYLKRQRQQQARTTNNKIRFIASGEYGETTGRPHYHMLAFNLMLSDLRPLSETLWTSETIQKCWKHGQVAIGQVTPASANYVCSYTIKKTNSNKNEQERLGLEKEFINMSRRPGIGRNYYERNKNKIYKTDEINYWNGKKVVTTKPPKYFDKLAEQELTKELEKAKEQRYLARASKTKLTQEITTVPQWELLKKIEMMNKIRVAERKTPL